MMIDRATKEQIEAILAMPQTPPYLKPVFEVVRDYGVGYLTLLQNGDGLDPRTLAMGRYRTTIYQGGWTGTIPTVRC
jgi:hypothetical protein